MKNYLLLIVISSLWGCGHHKNSPDLVTVNKSLCAALDENDLEAAKQGILDGADVNAQCTKSQLRPLEFSILTKNEEMTLLLLSSPTIKTVWSEHGKEVSALSLAVKQGASLRVLAALKPVETPPIEDPQSSQISTPPSNPPQNTTATTSTPTQTTVQEKPADPPPAQLDIDKTLPPKLQTLHAALLGKSEPGFGSLNKFETWAKLGQWEQFGPQNHYDWWMFPIKAFPGATGTTKQWAVTDAEVALLKNSALFMKHYREAVRLMALSWGYDIDAGAFLDHLAPQQKWNGYVIRMDKLGQSLKLFGEAQRFANLVNFRNHVGIGPAQTHWGM